MVYVVTIASYTENDNYLHTEQKTFTNKLFAQDYFEEQSDKARRECEWAEYWDADQDDRSEAYQYPVSEKKERDTYRVESEAYCGYHVCIKFEEQEIDVPVYAVTYASHAREEYDDTLHLDEPQVFFSKSEALNEYEGMKRYAENTAANDYDDTGDGKRYEPETDEDVSEDDTFRMFTAKRTDNPMSIYTGRVELHKL